MVEEIINTNVSESHIIDIMEDSHYSLATGKQGFKTRNVSNPGQPVRTSTINPKLGYF
jgi:hypothetical protein